jgi:CRISPR-associated protein Cas2
MMLVLITYDVSTSTTQGRRRLRHVARACLDYGQRVQNSVFECVLDHDTWTALRLRLLDAYDKEEDSLRFYFLGDNRHARVEHHGTKVVAALDKPLIA